MSDLKNKVEQLDLNATVKFRLEELSMILESIQAVGSKFENKVRETGSLTHAECYQLMLDLQTLYGVMRNTAPESIKALNAILSDRVGNVERIRPNVDRRRLNRK